MKSEEKPVSQKQPANHDHDEIEMEELYHAPDEMVAMSVLENEMELM